MSVSNFNELDAHVGHRIVCVGYAHGPTGHANVALECEDCCVVLIDYDAPEWATNTEQKGSP